MKRIVLVASLVLAAVVTPAALPAGQPAMERVVVDETFEDPELAAACGVAAVSGHAVGFSIHRSFAGDSGLVAVNTLNVVVTLSAGDNTFTLRDVGADVVRVDPDGTVILMIIGQIPFGWNGVLKIDLGTGEVILEPHHFTGDPSKACAALNP